MSEFAALSVFASIPVRDLSAATDWYSLVFGRRPDARPSPEIAEFYLAVDRVAQHGTLQLRQDTTRAGGGLATINVLEMDALVQVLEALGVVLVTERLPLDADTVSAVTVGSFEDPDGNAITLVQPHSR